jgi:uncharacterized protein (TIGR02588 family)
MTDSNEDRKRPRRLVQREAHWIEWLTGAVSGLVVIALIGWIAWYAPGEHEGMPALNVELGEIAAMDGGHRVSFTVVNSGRRTAAAVPVTARLMNGADIVEEREVTFDYVPALSSATGALLFSNDPAGHRLDIRASGYEDP